MGQSFTCLRFHLIFGTKDRRPWIDIELKQRLYDYIGGIVRAERGVLLAVGGTADHVHLLISAGQQTSVADLIRVVKTNSSKWVHETFPAKAGFAWQPGYAAFTVSQSNTEQVRRYLAGQEEHHRRVSFDEEFVAFLDRHGVEYDARFLLA